MTRVYLQEMVDDIPFDSLPINRNAFDIGAFSRRYGFDGGFILGQELEL